MSPINSHTPEARKLPIPAPRLQEAAALAAGVVGPNFRDDRCAGHPFRADPDADQEAQYRERLPVPGKGAERGRQRIGEDRQHHRPLAADIIGDDAADDAAGRPAEHGRRQDIAGVTRDLRILRGFEQLVQRKADGQEQRVDLEPVEQPAEVRGEQHLPLLAVERAIPRHRAARCADLCHHAFSLFRAVIHRFTRPAFIGEYKRQTRHGKGESAGR